MKFSKTPLSIRGLPANLGQHSSEILREAGYTEKQINEFHTEGVTIDGTLRTTDATTFTSS